jgi:hypothetical protein
MDQHSTWEKKSVHDARMNKFRCTFCYAPYSTKGAAEVCYDGCCDAKIKKNGEMNCVGF